MAPSEVATPGYGEFEFDLPEALLRDLVAKLDGLAAAPLAPESVKAIANEQGVYQLFLGGDLVYIGKTDGDAGLNQRLTRHAQKVMHRRNLDPARVSFKALRVFVFTAVDLESYLIRHYGGVRSVPWSGSGFGSNDPGRRRDTSEVKSEHFDALYPVDIDYPFKEKFTVRGSAHDALRTLRRSLPYTFRFGIDADLDKEVTVVGSSTTRDTIVTIVRQLPPGWQATALPGYVILYKEAALYTHGATIATS